MSKGSNSSTTNSSNSPSPVAYSSYLDLLNRATSVSQTPYQGYGGEEVAGLNSTQQTGIGGLNSLANAFQPYGEQAGSTIANAGAPITSADLSNYYDPYQQQVIDATQADFNEQNQRANSTVTGNAAAQGALGGNRVGVAQALTQQANTRAQAPIIAGLQSQGFQNAEQAAQTDKSRALQAGSAELQGAEGATQAQISGGTLQQQTQQSQDTQARADYFQQQGYPFATAQWLASIVLPTGSQMGSSATSQTQGPQPNQYLQAAGVGLSAAAMFSDRRLKENVEHIGKLNDGQKIYRFNFKGDNRTQIGLMHDEVEKKHPEATGQSGGFGTVDYEAATDSAVKRRNGGGIAGFADGGMPDVTGGMGWVPSVQVQGHPLAAPSAQPGKTNDQSSQDKALSGMGTSLGKVGKGLFDKWSDSPDQLGGTSDSPLPGLDASDYGVSSLAFESRGGRIPGFAGGGAPPIEEIDATDLPPIQDTPPSTAADRAADGVALRLAGHDPVEPNAVAASNADVIDDKPFAPTPVKTVSFKKPQDSGSEIVENAKRAIPLLSKGVAPAKALAFASRDDALPPDSAPDDAPTDISSRSRTPTASGAPAGVGAPQSTMGGFNPLGISDEARQGLISMGLGMMSSRVGGKGSFLAGVGDAGAQGMQTYASARAQSAALAAQARKETFEREKFNRPYSEMTAAEKERNRLSRIPQGFQQGADGSLVAQPGGPHDPHTIRSEAEAKLPPNLMTPTTLDAAADAFRMTGKLPPNMGRGTQGAMQATMIQNRAAEKEAEAGGDPADWPNRWQSFGTRATGMRTLENRAAGLTLAENEARSLLPRVREAMARVNRTRFPDLNSLLLAAKNKTGNEDEIKLGIAINSLIPVYARVMKPVGQVGQTDMANAQHLLEQKWSTGQMNAALEQFEVELHSAKEALAQARKEYGESGPSIGKKEPAAAAPAAAATGPTLSGVDKQALDWANANPSDPRSAAIKKRLKVP